MIQTTTKIGRIREDIVKGDDLVLVGSFDIGVAIGEKRIVAIGGGYIGILIGEECYLLSMKKPITINIARCGTLLSIGGRHGIAIEDLRANKAFLRKTYVTRLQASEAVISELCVIDELSKADILIFTDAHTYMKSIGEIREEKYAYKILQ